MKKIRIIQDNILKIFLVFFIAIIFWFIVGSISSSVKEDEIVKIFVTSSERKNYNIESEIKKNTNYKEIELKNYSLNDGSFGIYLATYGFVQADFLILPESVLKECDLEVQFQKLELKYDNSFLNDGDTYGLLIYSPNIIDSVWANSFTFTDENYYLLMSKNAKHNSSSNEFINNFGGGA